MINSKNNMNYHLVHYIDPIIPIISIDMTESWQQKFTKTSTIPIGITNENWKETFTKTIVSLNFDEIRNWFEISPLSFNVKRILCTKDFNLIIHRKNGPAIKYANGSKHWYKNGNPHRKGGPASEYSNGEKRWYKNGKLNRLDGGPSIERPNGDKFWYRNGRLHREDGPAIEYGNGDKHWFACGINFCPSLIKSCMNLSLQT